MSIPRIVSKAYINVISFPLTSKRYDTAMKDIIIVNGFGSSPLAKGQKASEASASTNHNGVSKFPKPPFPRRHCTPHSFATSGDETDHKVFVNRNLHLENIKFYGFDMDYTIAAYVSPEFEIMSFELLKEKMVKLGYPKEVMEYEYDPSCVVRGLWYDKHFGNLLKVDVYGNIIMARHGFRLLSPADLREYYPSNFIKWEDNRVYFLSTLFNLPETYLISCLIDYFTKRHSYNEDKTGVSGESIEVTFKSLFHDVRRSVDHIHEGNLKKLTLQNLSKYVKKDERLPMLLTRIRESGAKLFLLTNSDYSYTNQIMTYLMDFAGDIQGKTYSRDWQSYFDIMVVDAQKPLFFGAGSVFRKVDTATGALRIGVHKGPLTNKEVYSGGNSDIFTKLIGAKGKEVLYIGDHIYGDILKSKKLGGWKTFLVVPELDMELHVWTNKWQLFEELQALDVKLGDVYKDMDSSATIKPDVTSIRERIRAITNQMDQAYGALGSCFRSGSRQTSFSSQLVRYADLYAVSVYNLLYYPFSYMFRAPPMLLPHESTVKHENSNSDHNYPLAYPSACNVTVGAAQYNYDSDDESDVVMQMEKDKSTNNSRAVSSSDEDENENMDATPSGDDHQPKYN